MIQQLTSPISAVVFDCDGTLTKLEGIDELARKNGIGAEVQRLTAEAMDKTGLSVDLYQYRLNLVKHTQEQVLQLAEDYTTEVTPDTSAVIKLLQRLEKKVFIVSAGVNPAVKVFAAKLGVAAEQVFAVDLSFDAVGNYLDFDRRSPLVENAGKPFIVNQLHEAYPRILHVGDGLNDFATHDIVTRFVGYGGVYYREWLANACEFYLRSASMAALLPLALTQEECQKLTTAEQVLYEKGVAGLVNS
ncbi:phosphoserine phosphatase [soil metagenome]